MPEVNINVIAVVVAAVANMVIGFLWYGPLFGKKWIEIMNIDPKKMESMKEGMMKSVALGAGASLVTAAAIAYVMGLAGITSLAGGAVLGLVLWFGIIATWSLNSVLWEKRPVKLYALNNENAAVSFAVMGAIIAVL